MSVRIGAWITVCLLCLSPALVSAADDSSAREIEELRREVQELRKEIEGLRKRGIFLSDKKPEPPRGTPPGFAPMSGPSGIVNDIKCQPQLRVGEEATARRRGCRMTPRWTRLAFGNLYAGATGAYTNVAGSPNVAASLPITESSTTTYQVGIGFVRKPILNHLRGLLDDTGEVPAAVRNQGGILEDLLFNAVHLNAGISYGKALTTKDGSSILTSNSEPAYSVGIGYSVDIERLAGHVMAKRKESERPVDAGYIFQPMQGCDFWSGVKCDWPANLGQ